MKETNTMNIDVDAQHITTDTILREEELKKIYTQNFPAAKFYITTNSGTIDDAKDFYQDAYMAFWRNVQLGKFIPTNEHATGKYILTILKYKWIDHLRKNHLKIAEGMEQNVADIPHQSGAEDEYLDKIVAAFEKMGNPCKDVLHRFYYLKESLKNIAIKYEWTKATAKNNKYRCLQKLRKLVTSTL